jgi:phage gpG-like protein
MLQFSVVAPNIGPFFAAMKTPLKDFSLPASQYGQGLWVEIDRSLGNAVRDQIAAGGWGPHGAFAPLSPDYAKRKAPAGHGGEPILVRTGRLMRSFDAQGGSGDHVFEQSAMTMRTGSSLDYALYHQTGFETRLRKGGRGRQGALITKSGKPRPPRAYKPKPDGIAHVPVRRPLDPSERDYANWRTLMARYVTQRYRAAGFAVLGGRADVGEAKAAGEVFYAAGGGSPSGLALASGM